MFNIVKMAVLPKAMYRFNSIPNNTATLHRNRKKNLKTSMEAQRPSTSQKILNKKNNAGGSSILRFKSL